jgi:hypothetical protein
MKHHRTIIAATIVGLTVLASRAGAAFIVTDGTLHVAADYSSVDKPFVPPETDALVWIDGSMAMPPRPSLLA